MTTRQDTPGRTVSGASLGLALGVLTVWALNLTGLDVPNEPAIAIGTVWTFTCNRLIRRFG